MELIRYLFTEWNRHNDRQRHAEMRKALAANVASDSFDKIVLFALSREGLDGIDLSKVMVVDVERRPSFREVVLFCNSHYSGEQCVISNNDIEFPRSVDFPTATEKQVIAVSRHELSEGELIWFDDADYYSKNLSSNLPPHAFSNDAWIFQSPCPLKGGGNIFMGQMGCDQRFLWLCHMSGVKLSHATRSFQVVHHHSERSRNWSDSNRAALPGIILCENQEKYFYWSYRCLLEINKLNGIELMLAIQFMLFQFVKKVFTGSYDLRV